MRMKRIYADFFIVMSLCAKSKGNAIRALVVSKKFHADSADLNRLKKILFNPSNLWQK